MGVRSLTWTKITFLLFFTITLGFLTPTSMAYPQVMFTWTKLSVSLPFELDGYSNTAVYDSESDILLYFDEGDGRHDLMTTWAFDFTLGSWTKLSSSGFVRQAASVAYDRESDRIVLFGGNNYFKNGTLGYDHSTDTWAYDYNSDTWTNMTLTMSGVSPPARAWVDMTYDVESDRIILFGGREVLRVDPIYSDHQVINRNDTWAYDYNNNVWEEMTPGENPKTGWGYGITYDVESDRVILHGGMNDDFSHNETWAYDYNTDNWTKMITSVNPGPREVFSMAYNVITDQCILFGGLNYGGYLAKTGSWEPFDDMWVYDCNNNNWTELHLSNFPKARAGHEMVYNTKEDLLVLMGGQEFGEIYLHDMWTFGYEIASTSDTTTSESTSFVISPISLSFIVILLVYRRRKE